MATNNKEYGKLYQRDRRHKIREVKMQGIVDEVIKRQKRLHEERMRQLALEVKEKAKQLRKERGEGELGLWKLRQFFVTGKKLK